MNYMKTAILLAGMTALFLAIGYAIGGQGGMLLALVFSIGTNLFAYWNSDKMVLRMHGAMPASESQFPELHQMVHRLADNAGLPMPKVYVMDNPQPNAFATGRNPENAAVAATTGLLQSLTYEEAVSHKDCALGKWYYSEALGRYGEMAEIRDIELPHQRLHSLIKQIISHRERGDTDSAETLYSEIEPLSDEIIGLLNRVEQRIAVQN
jgi:hypothetical protein